MNSSKKRQSIDLQQSTDSHESVKKPKIDVAICFYIFESATLISN